MLKLETFATILPVSWLQIQPLQVRSFLLQTTRADPNVRNSFGYTMLEVAAMVDHLQAVQYLIAASAIVNPVITL